MPDNNPVVIDEEAELASVAERHSQIMESGERFFRRIGYALVGAIVFICGFLIFFFMK